MLAIKFKKVGKKNQAAFRLVVMEKRSKLQGEFVDDLGWVDPHRDTFSINTERVAHWLASGAQPTDTVRNLLIRAKAITGKKIPVHAKKKGVEVPAGPEANEASSK